MKLRRLLPIAITLLAGANAAFAAEASSSATASTTTREKPTFHASDTNRDGYVSRNEAQQAGVTDYSYADKNADGLLDADEFASASADSMRSSPSSSSSSSTPSSTPSRPTASDSSALSHTQ